MVWYNFSVGMGWCVTAYSKQPKPVKAPKTGKHWWNWLLTIAVIGKLRLSQKYMYIAICYMFNIEILDIIFVTYIQSFHFLIVLNNEFISMLEILRSQCSIFNFAIRNNEILLFYKICTDWQDWEYGSITNRLRTNFQTT